MKSHCFALKVVSAFSDEKDNLQTSTMEIELAHLRKLTKIAGDKAPDTLKKLFTNNNPLGKAAHYKGDALEYLFELIQRQKDPLQRGNYYKAGAVADKIKENLKNTVNGVRDYQLVKLMRDYGIKLRNMLMDELGDKELVGKDPRMQLFVSAFLSLKTVDSSRLSEFKPNDFFGGKTKTLDTSSDYYATAVDGIDRKSVV